MKDKYDKPAVKRKPRKVPVNPYSTRPNKYEHDESIGYKPDSGTFPGEEGFPEDQVKRTIDKLRKQREVATNKAINTNRLPTFTRKG
tara:strand:+ start:55 stop:315 length:261 start_codon:yes stop_codon:yes gene_type:complete